MKHEKRLIKHDKTKNNAVWDLFTTFTAKAIDVLTAKSLMSILDNWTVAQINYWTESCRHF